MKIRFLTTILLILSINVSAQIINYDSVDAVFANAYIGTVEKFFQRFNGEIFLPDFDTGERNYKENNLLSLFDGAMFGTKDTNDARYNEAKMLVADILKYNTKLKYNDTSWFATVPCEGILNKKNIQFVLLLTLEPYGDDMYKWTIAKAIGEKFKLKPSIIDDRLKIYPHDHNMNFHQLLDICKAKDLILNYGQKQYQVDETAVFYTYLYSGMLTIKRIADVQFSFYQVPEWNFTIKEFPRNRSTNAGWLITDFKKMDDNEKEQNLCYIYNTKTFSKPTIIHDTVIKTVIEYIPTAQTINKEEGEDMINEIEIKKDKNSEWFVGDVKMVYINDYDKYNYSYYIGDKNISSELWFKYMGNKKNFDAEVAIKKSYKFLKKLNKAEGKNFRMASEEEYEHAEKKGIVQKGDFRLRLICVETK